VRMKPSKPLTVQSTVKDPELIQQRRRQIVAASVKLFQEKGFHKTTTREIARESGFSIGTLYEYIESKEDVLYLVCQYIHDRVEERLKELLPAGLTGRETLEKAITAFIQVMDEMRGEVLLIYQEAKSLTRDALRHVLQREEEITQIFADILRRGLADGTLSIPEEHISLWAHDIVELGEMWAFRRWTLKDKYTLESYTQHQLSLLLPPDRVSDKTGKYANSSAGTHVDAK